MDDFFRQANKYAILEDNIWVTSPQILVTTRPVQDNKSRNSKTLGNATRPNSQKPIQYNQDKNKKPLCLTSFTITYDQLISVIQNLIEFRWFNPMWDPMRKDQWQQCS